MTWADVRCALVVGLALWIVTATALWPARDAAGPWAVLWAVECARLAAMAPILALILAGLINAATDFAIALRCRLTDCPTPR